MAQTPGAAGRAFTTRGMIDLERDTIRCVQATHSQLTLAV